MAPYRRPPRKLSQRCEVALMRLREEHAKITAGDRPMPRGHVTAPPTDYSRRPLKISVDCQDAIEKLSAQAEAKVCYLDKTA